jgi:hypothetical protein
VNRFALIAAKVAFVLLAIAFWAVPASPAAAAPWCGTVSTTDRLPQVPAGNAVHAIYAVPSDLADRSPQVAQQLVDDAERIDAWWRREDPSRTLRFDLFPYPCGAQLDVTILRLPESSAQLRPVEGRADAIVRAMLAARFDSRFQEYLVYYDGPTAPLPDGYEVCGQGGQLQNGSGIAIVYLSACAGVPSAPTAVHELLHGLGAVPDGALHPCPDGDSAHACDSESDIMYPFASGQPLDPLVLDVGRDDYYGHAGGWPDVQDSAWLVFLNAQVRLTVGVTGRGGVRSDVPGINCSTPCNSDWNGGTKVVLTAQPAQGQKFVEWTGACTGAGPCSLDLSQAASVGAVFAPGTYALRVRKTGQGTVRGARGAIACGSRCAAVVSSDTPATLTASPAKGWRFRSWSGACRGTRPTCVVRLTGPSSARATFVRRR